MQVVKLGARVQLRHDGVALEHVVAAAQKGPQHVESICGGRRSARLVIDEDLTRHAPLGNTERRGELCAAQLLLEVGADPDWCNLATEEGTAIKIASCMGYAHLVTLLLEHGADANYKSIYTTTPLCYACERGHAAMVKLLLVHGAEIQGDDGDESPEASGGDKFHEGDVVEVRFKGGNKYGPAKISRDNGDGSYDVEYDVDFVDNETGVTARSIRKLLRSPLAIARREGHAEIVALLEESSRG